MPTRDEIERRVQQNDTSLSAKRSAAAQQVGELAERRAAIAEQLGEVERHLGGVLTDATAVMDIAELARFTDVPAADLTRWLTARKPARGKRKKPTVSPTEEPADSSSRRAEAKTASTGLPAGTAERPSTVRAAAEAGMPVPATVP